MERCTVVVLATGNIGNYRCRFSYLKRNEVPVAGRKWQESWVSLLKFPLSRVVSSIVVCHSKRNIIRSLFMRWREIILFRVDHSSKEDEFTLEKDFFTFLFFNCIYRTFDSRMARIKIYICSSPFNSCQILILLYLLYKEKLIHLDSGFIKTFS